MYQKGVSTYYFPFLFEDFLKRGRGAGLSVEVGAKESR